MDGRRFDQLTQTLARRLGQDGGAELDGPARPAGQPAPTASPPASGTCPSQDLAPTAPGGQGHGAAWGICGWEDVPVAADGRPRPPVAVGRAAAHRLAQPLSAREQEVAALIGQGLKDREIAAALVLSEHTVHAHVRNLLAKLGLASRTQIAAWVTARAPDDQRSVPREPAEP